MWKIVIFIFRIVEQLHALKVYNLLLSIFFLLFLFIYFFIGRFWLTFCSKGEVYQLGNNKPWVIYTKVFSLSLSLSQIDGEIWRDK